MDSERHSLLPASAPGLSVAGGGTPELRGGRGSVHVALGALCVYGGRGSSFCKSETTRSASASPQKSASGWAGEGTRVGGDPAWRAAHVVKTHALPWRFCKFLLRALPPLLLRLLPSLPLFPPQPRPSRLAPATPTRPPGPRPAGACSQWPRCPVR